MFQGKIYTKLSVLAALAVYCVNSSTAIGCNSVTFDSGSSLCYAENVEVMPDVNIGSQSLPAMTDSVNPLITECRSRCTSTENCAYFTVVVQKNSKSATCLLKPSASMALIPKFASKKYSSTSTFSYWSGPKSCSDSCIEGTSEIVAGCGASSPAVCEIVGMTDPMAIGFFDSDCKTSIHASCGFRGYQCCRGCLSETVKAGTDLKCCGKDQMLRVGNSIFSSGGQNLPGSQHIGIIDARHCENLCVANPLCTHWNFIGSDSTSHIGGGCYMQSHLGQSAVSIILSTGAANIVGSRDCERDYGIKKPTDIPDTPIDPPVTKECVMEGYESSRTYQIFETWSLQPESACKKFCQATDGCRFWGSVQPGHCGLYLSDEGLTKTDGENHLWGARDCEGDVSTVPTNECQYHNTDTEAVVPSADDYYTVTDVTPHHCGSICHYNDRCTAWSFDLIASICYVKQDAANEIEKLGIFSGRKGCWENLQNWVDNNNSNL